MARTNRREGKRPSNRDTWIGRYKAKPRYRMERPFDAVWRKILAQTVPYIDPQENTLSIPQGKARASVPPGVIPRTAEVVDAVWQFSKSGGARSTATCSSEIKSSPRIFMMSPMWAASGPVPSC
jgi:hypothetical protein